VLDKINASLIPLLFKPFVKFDIAYSPPPSRRHLSFQFVSTYVLGKASTHTLFVRLYEVRLAQKQKIVERPKLLHKSP
jgi:hypothetical protein